MRQRFLCLILLAVLEASVLAQEVPSEQTPLDPAQTAARLEEAKAKLDGLPGGAEESVAALLKIAWQRRVELLDEATRLFGRAQALEALPAQIEERKQALDQRRKDLEAQASPTAPETPTAEGLAALETQIAEQRDRVTSFRAIESKSTQRTADGPTLSADARKRLQSALERAARLAQERDEAADAEQKDLLGVRQENALLDAEVARLETRVLERERALQSDLDPLQLAEREFAERRLANLEQQHDVYAEALGAAIDLKSTQKDEEIRQLEAALNATSDPAERFLAEKRLAIARFQKQTSGHEKIRLALKSDLEEQQRRLSAEQAELVSLSAYLDKVGDGELAGERIKFTMQRLKTRRQSLERTLSRDVISELGESRSRRIELENKLFGVRDDWNEEVEKTAAQLGDREAARFRQDADEIFEPYRSAMRTEKDVLTDLIGLGQELQLALVERGEALADLEGFIRSKVFWIRDALPLGPEILPRVNAEWTVVATWARGLGSTETRDELSASVKKIGTLAAALFLLVVLPIALYWTRQKLRRIVTRMNDRALKNETGLKDRLATVGTSIVSVAMVPTCFFIASRVALVAELPETIAPVLSNLLEHLAVMLLGLFFSRSFFAGRGTAQVQFGMDQEASHRLHLALRIAFIGYFVFHSIGSVLARPPFILDGVPLETLPRLANTAFLICAFAAIILVLQPRSAFSRYWQSTFGTGFVARRWPIFSTLACLVLVGVVGLQFAGYRYSAGVLAAGLTQSLLVFLALSMLFKVVAAASETIVTRRLAAAAAGETAAATEEERPASSSPSGGGGSPAKRAAHETADGDSTLARVAQVRATLRVLFIIGGGLIVAGLWGLDIEAIKSLDLVKVYDIRDTGEIDEFVSLFDLLETLLYGVGTYFLLKTLPGIYEFAIFPQVNFDSGLKYAVLTISRYGVFTIGLLLVLSALHLDLSRLGWLMAAVGVGLGFGLQEIVSNFVSGIILLVERPVRVGDVVTIGSTSGKVQRINIRATTVINFDRQEIIVPNRSLITQDVTNWTRGDTIIRLVVPIGVAYGTDVEQVTALLLQIAKDQPEVMTDPAPSAFFLNHGESSLDFELRVFVPDPSVKVPLLHRINTLINRKLDELGIEIPFPQRDLHIRSSAVPLAAPHSGKDVEQSAQG